MTERNVFKFDIPLWLLFLRLEMFLCLSDANSMHHSIMLKFYPSTSFIVSHRPFPLSKLASDIGSGLPYFVTGGGGKTLDIPWRSDFYSCKIYVLLGLAGRC